MTLGKRFSFVMSVCVIAWSLLFGNSGALGQYAPPMACLDGASAGQCCEDDSDCPGSICALNGNLSCFAALEQEINSYTGVPMGVAVDQLDDVDDGFSAGDDGFQDEPLDDSAVPLLPPLFEPLMMHSSINVGNFLLVYVPDSDADLAVDSSWLAVGINIGNGDGDIWFEFGVPPAKTLIPPSLPEWIMVPFDSDGNGDPGVLGTVAGGDSRWMGVWGDYDPISGFGEDDDRMNLWMHTCVSQASNLLGRVAPLHLVYEQNNASRTSLRARFWESTSTEVVVRNNPELFPGVEVFPPDHSTTGEIALRGEDFIGTAAPPFFPDGLGNDDIAFFIPEIDTKLYALFNEVIIEPASGGNGTADTAAMGDDIMLIAEVGDPVVPGQTLILAGPNGVLDTATGGDDEVYNEDFRTVTRFRIANLGLGVRSDATGDRSNEDYAETFVGLDIPEIEVTKDVRCKGDVDWDGSVQALPGSTLEFRIEVNNTGNVPLYVTLEDIISGMCDEADVVPIFNAIQDGGNGIVETTLSGDDVEVFPGETEVEPGAVIILPGLNCIPDSTIGGDDVLVSTTMSVTLYDDLGYAGVKEVPINFLNADKGYCTGDVAIACENDGQCGGAGMCVPLEFSPEFFGFVNNVFLCDVLNGNEAGLGTLDPVDVCGDLPLLGDRVEITFEGLVLATEDLCDNCEDEVQDIINTITATGDMDGAGEPSGNEVSGVDSVDVDVVCRDIDLVKMVRLLPDGAWASEDSGVASIAAGGFPADVQYLVEFDNLGDITERVTLTEDSLCDDILTIPVIIEPAAGDGIANTTALASDIQVIAVGDPAAPGDVIILPGPDGVLNTTVVSDDVTGTGIGNISFVDVIGEPVSGGNGVANTTKSGDDVQVIASGQPVSPGDVIILPGPNGILDTAPAPDDVVQNCGSGGLCNLPAFDDVPAGGKLVKTCTIRIANEAAALALCMADDDDPTCSSDNPNPDTKTYRNCIEASAEGVELDEICDGAPPVYHDSYAEISRRTCELDVTKQVMCLDNCADQNPVGGWVDSLDVIRGTAMAFKIGVANISEIGTEPVCALKFKDLFPTGLELCDNPGTTVQLINGAGDPFCTVPGGWFKGDNSEFELDLPGACGGAVMNPGDEVVVRTAAEVTDSAPFGDGVNQVEVTGAVSCPGGEMPAYSCTDLDEVGISVKNCDIEVTKEVKCKDEDDLAYAGHAEGVPGSMLTFRIQVCNTGGLHGANITKVEITDVLSEPTWYVQGTIYAEISGAGGGDVTSCICTTPVGNCDQITDINGLKDLASCVADGIPPGECLTITFDVLVPASFTQTGQNPDCTNSVTVGGFADVCLPDGACDQDNDSATIDVKVPKPLECDKQICADMNNDGDCDDDGDFAYTASLDLLCDTEFPFTLIYRMQTTNPSDSETALVDVTVCDLDLITDADAAGFTVNPCDLDPVTGCKTCARLEPGESCTAVCHIYVPGRTEWEDFATNDCYTNTVDVDGDIDPEICIYPTDNDWGTSCSATVCVSRPCDISVTKQIRCWDDCVEPVDPEAGWVDDLEAVPGSCVEYRIVVENVSTESVPVCALKFVDEMTNEDNFTTADPQNVRVTGPSVCDWDTGDQFNWDGVEAVCNLVDAGAPAVPRSLAPTEKLTVLFTAVLKGAADIGDDPDDSVNTVTVEGAADCPVGAVPVWCCGPLEDTATLDIEECDITVEKEVKCTDLDDLTYGSDVEALPGTSLTFRIQVTNTGDVNIGKVCIEDDLGCPGWLADPLSSLTATIGTDNVLTCMPGLEDEIRFNDGAATCFEDWLACRPAAPHIAPGETLTITFEVTIPAEFGSVEDCLNEVTVGAYAGVCSPEGPCAEGSASASISGVVPALDCDKDVCADFDLNGNCDTWYSPNLTLSPSDFDYPIRLAYRFTAINPGEVDLTDVLICDEQFVLDVAAAPGVTFVSCDLDGVSGCYDCGDLASANPDETCTAECTIEIADQQAWETFATYDGIHNCPPLGDPDRCYDNWVEVTGSVDVVDDPNICPAPDMDDLLSTCHARVAIQNACIPPPCPPVTKVMFDIWNQNEVHFSGTEKCISSWDESLLSEYSIINHFLIEHLQTNKGQARIQGVASDVVCGPEAESIDAPLLGVAVKMIDFDETLNANVGDTDGMAGMPLVGTGTEEGQVIGSMVWMGAGAGAEDGATGGSELPIDLEAVHKLADLQADDSRSSAVGLRDERDLSRASTTQKGSLLVYPKVEVKWNSAGEVIQDTFIEMTNDYHAGVEVQFFLVDGDMCVLLDNRIMLTGNEPCYWSVASGMPKGVAPITALGPACPDPDPDNPYGTRIRGYIVAWAVTNWGQEIRWNHLQGGAVIMHYGQEVAWEYTPWAFAAVAGSHGSTLLNPPYVMDLDGVEYDAAPGALLLDFYAPTAILGSGEESHAIIDTDLTLWAAIKNMSEYK